MPEAVMNMAQASRQGRLRGAEDGRVGMERMEKLRRQHNKQLQHQLRDRRHIVGLLMRCHLGLMHANKVMVLFGVHCMLECLMMKGPAAKVQAPSSP
eukprot:scaffold188930_cov13-Tisochrysis_lutea.AAC.1